MSSCEITLPKYELEPSILDHSIGSIAIKIEQMYKHTKILDAFLRFMNDEKLSLIPVVDENNIVIGQIHRNRFLENVVLGKFGYGIHLNSKKSLCEVMEIPSFVVDYNISLEEASLMIQKRNIMHLYDDLIVTENNKYYGVVPIHVLLEVVAKRSIILAKESNPLTGLPGNWAIQREVERRIRLKIPFDVCYIDINHFKPYNDYYGFEKGDTVIFSLGNILLDLSKNNNEIFVGHIGGDDFIIICPPEISESLCSSIVKSFEELLPVFHGEDFIKGYYISKNRKGEQEIFNLLSLACAIVSNKTGKISSFAHLASIASEVKSEAKKLARINKTSVIFKDRRNY